MKGRLLVYFALLLQVFVGCSPKIVYVPVEHTEYVTVRDTTVLHRTDTLVQIPEVSIADYIDLNDTLRISAPFAEMSAWVDSTFNKVAGTLKQGGKLPVQVIEKERLVYRDSIQVKEVPVPVEVEKIVKHVPWIYRVMTGIGFVAIGLLFGWLLGKFLFKGINPVC